MEPTIDTDTETNKIRNKQSSDNTNHPNDNTNHLNDNTNYLNDNANHPNDNTNYLNSPIGFPEIGEKIKGIVTRVSFHLTVIKITEVNGLPALLNFKGILKNLKFSEGEYSCDNLRVGDLVECLVVSFNEHEILLSLVKMEGESEKRESE